MLETLDRYEKADFDFVQGVDVEQCHTSESPPATIPAEQARQDASHVKQYAEAALADELNILRNTTSRRNDQLNKSSHAIGQMVGAGWFDHSYADAVLYAAAVENGYVAKDGEGEARATIRSGLAAGMKEPRQLPGSSDVRTPQQQSTATLTSPASNDHLDGQQEPHPLMPADLLRDYPELRQELIHNVLRRGEVGNIIAAPKTRKSWLMLALAVAYAMGWPWLEMFQCAGGRVLLLDLELHKETLAKRLRDVLYALRLSVEDLGDRLHVECLRGRQFDIVHLAEYAGRVGSGRYDLVLIDPLFKLLPRDADENANVQMSNLYSSLMAVAENMQAGILLVHHLAKGDNAGKALTDLGAGAGAQSRACDAHLTLREHAEPDCVVFDGVVRSWPPISPLSLRWQYPQWMPAPELDPTHLKQRSSRSPKKAEKPPVDPVKPVEAWTPQRFATAFIGNDPKMRGGIIAEARAVGLSLKQAESLLSQAEGGKLAFRWKLDKDTKAYFASRRQESLTGGVE